jgi:hypothetical protein
LYHGRQTCNLAIMKRRIRIGFVVCSWLAIVVSLTGCGSETLFKSNFDSTSISQPPSPTQAVGTAEVEGPPGSVVVVSSPVSPSGRWVQISWPTDLTHLPSMRGNFAQLRGAGRYTFSSVFFIPSGTGVATVQFEQADQVVTDPPGLAFCHLDFTQDNRVRIDDKTETTFGTFPRDQAFILQVTLDINPTAPAAHIVLSGAGASGETDYAIIAAERLKALQFGAVRIGMGFPNSGRFDATNIVVTYQSSRSR